MKVLVLAVIFALAAAGAEARGGRVRGAGAERRLFLSLNRNQKFYRQEDRQRCELSSPGGDEPHNERADAAADDQDPAPAD